ncbi:MAG: glycerol-3-phosphate responsive antiterminator [Acholeplasmataceae bacterium]
MLEQQSVIPAISNHRDFKRFLELPMTYGILMNFQLAQLGELVSGMRKKNKKVLIHSELIKGLSPDEFGAIYLIQVLGVDGIISSKPKVIETCHKRQVIGIFRFFLKDSISLEQSIDIARRIRPEFIEMLPATGFKFIPVIKKSLDTNVLLGGLIETKAEIERYLKAGAFAITTSNPDFW